MAFKISATTFVVSLLIGLFFGSFINWPGLASLVAVCMMGYFILTALEEKKDK